MARQVTAAFERTATVMDVTGQPTRNGKMKYVVQLSTGEEPVTFSEALARKATELKGQNVVARIEHSQNGQYTNVDLADIDAAGATFGAGIPSTPVVNTTPVTIPTVAAPAPRDFQAEAEGKTRHGQFIAALNFLGDLYSGSGVEDLTTLLEQAIYVAQVGTEFAMHGPPNAGAGENVPTIDELKAAGVVQVGTSGLPWQGDGQEG